MRAVTGVVPPDLSAPEELLCAKLRYKKTPANSSQPTFAHAPCRLSAIPSRALRYLNCRRWEGPDCMTNEKKKNRKERKERKKREGNTTCENSFIGGDRVQKKILLTRREEVLEDYEQSFSPLREEHASEQARAEFVCAWKRDERV